MEKLLRGKWGFIPNNTLSPLQQHQIFEEVLQKQKEFASEIYIQKDLERRNY